MNAQGTFSTHKYLPAFGCRSCKVRCPLKYNSQGSSREGLLLRAPGGGLLLRAPGGGLLLRAPGGGLLLRPVEFPSSGEVPAELNFVYHATQVPPSRGGA